MKKLVFISQILFVLFLCGFSVNPAEAITPEDGHYDGLTSQGNEISFDVVSGNVGNVGWYISPTCNPESGGWSGSGWPAQFYGEYFVWQLGLRLNPSGNPIGVVAGHSGISLYGRGIFTTTTTANGVIWHTLPYFTGVGLNTSSCLDKSITFSVSRTGPVPSSSEGTESQKGIVIYNEQGETIGEVK